MPNTNTTIKALLDIIQIVRKEEILYFEVSYHGILCYVRLLPFQVNMPERTNQMKQIACVYNGLDDCGVPKLTQDRDVLIEELYEEDTVHTFSYIRTEPDFHSEVKCEYHLMRDVYGLKHRLYATLTDEQKTPGARVEVYVRGINEKNKTLILSLFNPKIDRYEKIFYDADRVFEEIGEINNKELYFDYYLAGNEDDNKITKFQHDFIGQYNGESNLWLFSYMNLLDSVVVSTCLKKHQIEELAVVCQIMIKLQEWMVEGSTFLDLFGDETKNTTLAKSNAQILKYNRLLLSINVVRKGEHNKYIGDIIDSIRKSGRIAIRREERLEVMTNILRIYPEFFNQDIETTCLLAKSLLDLEEGVGKDVVEFLSMRLEYYVEADIRKMRSGVIRSNEIDTTQTLLINEVLSLLCILAIIQSHERYGNEMEARTSKAKFFRFLSFVCSQEMQPAMIKAGIDALVGVIDTNNIFTWENAINVNPTVLSNLTSQATVLDCNMDNDYYFMRSVGKTGIIHLDSTGFTIVPYKQCLSSIRTNLDYVNETRILHHLDALPLKLGTMLNIPYLTFGNHAVEHFILWNSILRHPESLVAESTLPKPNVGDRVRVCVKKQKQPDKLKGILFVSVADNRFASVDGILTYTDISSKWISDVRNLFDEGDVFYAEVCRATEDGRYQFSIRNDVDKYSADNSTVEDDVKHLIVNSDVTGNFDSIPKSLLQELILLVDMRIRKETNAILRLTLIGYAYCLSSLVSDSKSYYYDFLLRYYATIDKFVRNTHHDVVIKFHDTIDDKFVDIRSKRRLVELLSYANNQDADGLQALQVLAKEESDNDVGKLSAMLVAYIYTMKAGFSATAMTAIKEEIDNYICNSDKLDLSALNTNEIEEENSDDYSEGSDIDVGESSTEIKKESVVHETPTNETATESTNQVDIKCETANAQKSKPFKINILDDGSLVLQEDLLNAERLDAQVEIGVPDYAMNGLLLLINNEGGICKVGIKDIFDIGFQKTVDGKINPYLLSNYFVVPEDCIVGTIIATDNRKYVEIYRTTDISACNISQIEYKRICDKAAKWHQPFILPRNCEIDGLIDRFDRCIDTDDIPRRIIEGLQSYGVFI